MGVGARAREYVCVCVFVRSCVCVFVCVCVCPALMAQTCCRRPAQQMKFVTYMTFVAYMTFMMRMTYIKCMAWNVYGHELAVEAGGMRVPSVGYRSRFGPRHVQPRAVE